MFIIQINPLNAELNPICHLLALLEGATVVVVSRLRVKHMQILLAKTIFEKFQVALLALNIYEQNITSYFLLPFAPWSRSLSCFTR